MGFIKRQLKKIAMMDFHQPAFKLPENSIDVGKYPLIRPASFGGANPDKKFYVIFGHKAGLFSNLQYVLAQLRLAERLGMIPVVDYQNFPNTYYDGREILSNANSWEYFFNPVSPFKLDEVYVSKNVFFCGGSYAWDQGSYLSNHGLFDYYQKYIVPRKEISDEIDSYYHALIEGRRVLGIHFRGYEQNIAQGHPFCPTTGQMLKLTDEIFDKYAIDNIFLVTEEQDYLDIFMKRYGSKVFFTPYYRTYKKNAYLIESPRKGHVYQLGKEIMIGAYLLARCTGLLHASSNVSEFARFINRGNYLFRYEVKNGVNSDNPIIAKYLYNFKKLLPPRLGGLKNEVIISV